ncbi:MAG: prepilin-type N-terminal cleavage/methylation domain-containing protein [Rubripirellula sp.]|nr:prepilin-type N-terminal cleavage/methylation domain-containing protein [Rubripirellula sp.]
MKNKMVRQGYTLIELSISMTVGSTLLILSAGLIHQVMRYHSVTRDRAHEHQILDRLGGDLRHDIHRAIAAQLKAANEVELEYDGNRFIHYKVNRYSVEKTHAQANRTTRMESYTFKRPIVGSFELLESPQLVSLTIQSPEEIQGTRKATPRRISASLSRVARHEIGEVSDE